MLESTVRDAFSILPLILLIIFSSLGCKSEREVSGGSKPSVPNQVLKQVKTAQKPVSRGEISYAVPEGWVRQKPSSPMRYDQFLLPGAGDRQSAELAVFSGIGGSVEANLDRWYKQFKQPDGQETKDLIKRKKIQVADLTVTVVSLTGTFMKSRAPMMMGGPVDELGGYALLAAIAETKQGLWFFKATGPEDTINRWQKSFDEFVQSFRVN